VLLDLAPKVRRHLGLRLCPIRTDAIWIEKFRSRFGTLVIIEPFVFKGFDLSGGEWV
jgi:hypothetical protein